MLVKVPVKAVCIGWFAGGSFGVHGNPSRTYLIWTVRCAANMGDHPLLEYTFGSKSQAKAKVEEVLASQAEAERKHQKAVADAKAKASHLESLSRGWDGYQFVGVAEGRRRLQSLIGEKVA